MVCQCVSYMYVRGRLLTLENSTLYGNYCLSSNYNATLIEVPTLLLHRCSGGTS